MTEYEQMYARMHRIKIAVAVSATLLIGSAFLAIFMGAYKITPGLQNSSYENYENFHMPVPARVGEPYQVVAYSTREVIIDDDERTEGSNTVASVVRFDMPTGKHSLRFDGPEPLMNVGHVENANEWYNGSSGDAVLLVQFAMVEATETTFADGADRTIKFRNETGSYRTFTWNLSAPALAGSTLEVTDAIGAGSRIVGAIRLPYDPSDDEPDYILITTNKTWQEERMHLSPDGILYSMFAMHANGSCEWSTSSNTSGSILDFGSTMLWHDVHGFAFNSSHFVVQLPDAVGIANIKTGEKAWAASGIREAFECPRDYSGDGLPDLVCFNSSKHITCIDGKNGSAVANFTAIPLGSADGYSARMHSRFGTDFDLFIEWDSSMNRTRSYRHDVTGVSLLWEIAHGDYQLNNWHVPWVSVSCYAGEPLQLLHLGMTGTDESYCRMIDCLAGTTIGDVDKYRGYAIAGDFFGEWGGPE
ncbi:MAG: hypothetical protein JW839_13835, partial [Candidatus Lokiarchaeota archaeon]|nr:hypothetical protein [Candidatus Lokiarchaeota archaeon]